MSKSQVTTFYIIRHAESYNNVNKIVGGDPELTDNGINQAKHLSKELSKIHFDYAFASKFTRAKETAKLILNTPLISVISSKALNERDYGIYEGQPIAKFNEELKDVLTEMRALSDDGVFSFRRYESCETDEEMIKRFVDFLNEITEKYLGKTVLISTHGILIRVFLIYLKHAGYKQLHPYAIKNAGYIIVESSGKEIILKECHYS